MDRRKSITNIKEQAKERLLGNYRIAVGSFVLLFVTVYAISSLVLSAYDNSFMFIKNGASAAVSVPLNIRLMDFALSNLLTLAISAFSAILSAGLFYILEGIVDNKIMTASDIFYSFRNHPDKVIIMSVIISLINLVCTLPANIYNMFFIVSSDDMHSSRFIIYILLLIAGFAINFIVAINFVLCYLIYLDDTNKSVSECMRDSYELMKGNRIRYCLMILSFAGYFVLGILSIGIGLVYLYPYVYMSMIIFYRDLTGKYVDTSRIVEASSEPGTGFSEDMEKVLRS